AAPGTVAARPRITALGRTLAPRATAWEGESERGERLLRARVVLGAGALVLDGAVPVQGKALERTQHLVRATGNHRRRIQILDALQRVVDLADQLALAVAGAQLEAEFLFLGGAVVGIGEVSRLVLHVRDRTIHLHHEVALPAVENQPEVLELLLAHVLFAAL